MPGLAITNNFEDVLDIGFRKIFFNHFNLVGDQNARIFAFGNSDRAYEDFSYVTDMGPVPKATEGSALTFDAPLQGFDIRFTHDTYRKGYKVTQEMQEDDLHQIFSRMPAALGTSMATTRNQVGANIYNNSFDSGVQTGADGLELFSDVHVYADGSTFRNELSTAATLSVDSLEQALLDIRATLNDAGNLLNLKPVELIVAPALQRTAKEILGSIQDPESANNTINTMSSGHIGLNLVVNDYLTSATAWFIKCTIHPMLWIDRISPSHTSDNEFTSDNRMFKVRARWSVGWTPQVQGIFGTPGV